MLRFSPRMNLSRPNGRFLPDSSSSPSTANPPYAACVHGVQSPNRMDSSVNLPPDVVPRESDALDAANLLPTGNRTPNPIIYRSHRQPALAWWIFSPCCTPPYLPGSWDTRTLHNANADCSLRRFHIPSFSPSLPILRFPAESPDNPGRRRYAPSAHGRLDLLPRSAALR